ncbi:MAG: M23 family peptidase [Leptolyngbya sp. DLM2.Bin15]|nr:MAG: M23 family peptidase [Leptolyngbya sp. DLM2.Bin15]
MTSSAPVADPIGTIARGTGLLLASLISLTVGTSLTAGAAVALEVEIRPTNPQLGDTLTILVQAESADEPPPVVTMGDRTFPTFPLGNNQFQALLPTTPLDDPGRVVVQVTGETVVRNLAVWVRDRSFPTQSLWISGASDLGTDYEFDRVDEFKELVSDQQLWSGSFLRPTSGPVTTIYGVRRYYNGVFAEDYYHRGVDYAAPTGTPVVAPAAGIVALVDHEANGFEIHGNTVGLDHGQGVASIFLHLNRIDVREGDRVEAGQVIGTVGNTGISTGPHLHWGLYVHGRSVDPVPWRGGAE